MNLGLEKAARISTITLAALAVAGAGIWAYGRIDQWRGERAARRRAGIGTSWPYHSGAQLLAAFDVNSRQDLLNIGKSNSKWPQWIRWLRTESGWARAGGRYADEFNETLAQISILDPVKAKAFALEFVMLVRVQRVQTPEERRWRKSVLDNLTGVTPTLAVTPTHVPVSASLTPSPSTPPARLVAEEDLEWSWFESPGVKKVGPRAWASGAVDTFKCCNRTPWTIYSLRVHFDSQGERTSLGPVTLDPGDCA